MKRYNVQRLSDSRYYAEGEWSEEPEWFSAKEAEKVKRDMPLTAVKINEHEFSAADCE